MSLYYIIKINQIDHQNDIVIFKRKYCCPNGKIHYTSENQDWNNFLLEKNGSNQFSPANINSQQQRK